MLSVTPVAKSTGVHPHVNTPFSASGQQAGITALASHWVDRITKASYAQRALEMSIKEHGITLPSLRGSLTYLEGTYPVGDKAITLADVKDASEKEAELENIFEISEDLELVKFAREFDFRRSERLDHEKWEKEFKALVYKRAGGRTDIRMGGQKWGKYAHDGIFAYKKFAEEQPGLVEEYSVWKTEKVLDTERLKREKPQLYRQYQAASLHRLKD